MSAHMSLSQWPCSSGRSKRFCPCSRKPRTCRQAARQAEQGGVARERRRCCEQWTEETWLRAHCARRSRAINPRGKQPGGPGQQLSSLGQYKKCQQYDQHQQQYISSSTDSNSTSGTAHLAGVLIEDEPRLLEPHAGGEPRGHAPHLHSRQGRQGGTRGSRHSRHAGVGCMRQGGWGRAGTPWRRRQASRCQPDAHLAARTPARPSLLLLQLLPAAAATAALLAFMMPPWSM